MVPVPLSWKPDNKDISLWQRKFKSFFEQHSEAQSRPWRLGCPAVSWVIAGALCGSEGATSCFRCVFSILANKPQPLTLTFNLRAYPSTSPSKLHHPLPVPPPRTKQPGGGV